MPFFVEERLDNHVIEIVLKSMNRGEYDEPQVKRLAPKDIQDECRKAPVSSLLYCLRLVPHTLSYDRQVLIIDLGDVMLSVALRRLDICLIRIMLKPMNEGECFA